MSAVHDYGPDLRGLGLDDEMEDIEIGEDAALEWAMERFAGGYIEEDRPGQMGLLLRRRIFETTGSYPVSDAGSET